MNNTENEQVSSANNTDDSNLEIQELHYTLQAQINAIEAMGRVFEIIRCMDTVFMGFFEKTSPLLTAYLPEACAFLNEKEVMNSILLKALLVLEREHNIEELLAVANEVELLYVEISQKYKLGSMFIEAIGDENPVFWENMGVSFYIIYNISVLFPTMARNAFLPLFVKSPSVFSVFFYMFGEDEIQKMEKALTSLFNDKQYRSGVCLFLRSIFLDRKEDFDKLLGLFEEDPSFSFLAEENQQENVQQ